MLDCFRPTRAGLEARVVRGGAWFAMFIAFRALVTIGTTAVLARLLTPADFGYVAMAAVATDLAGMFCVLGIPWIVAQTRRITRLDLDSIFWFSVAIGSIAMLAVVAAAPLVATVFKEPALAPVLCAMSTILLIEELSTVHFSIANRLLLVRHEFVCQAAGLIVRAGVNIALAVGDCGVWSLVWGSIVGRLAYVVMLWWLIPYWPRFRFNARFFRRNVRAGASYFGSATVFFLSSNVDPALVGRMFGATQLGYYQTAFALPEEMRSRMAVATVRLLFPAFAMLQSDLAAFRSNVLRSLRIFAAIVVPMGAGMAVVADPIVRVLYGSQWAPVVPILQIAAVIGVARALQAFLVNIYRAKGRPDLEFKIGSGLFPALLAAILIGRAFGPVGVAGGLLVFSVISLISTYPALRLIVLEPRDVLSALLPATVAATAMSLVLLGLGALEAIPQSTAIVELAASVAIGVVAFVVVLFVVSRKTVDDFWSVVRILRLR